MRTVQNWRRSTWRRTATSLDHRRSRLLCPRICKSATLS